jgi:large subunit ribosomal protein L24
MLKKGKQVEIICGNDKGKKGEIIELIKKHNKVKVKVKGINFIKKHEKTTKEKKGGIITKENFIDISNIKILDSVGKNSKGDNKK